MKICFSFISYELNSFGGVQNSIYNLALGFAANNIDIIVYSSNLFGADLHTDDIPVYRSSLIAKDLSADKQKIHQILSRNSNDLKEEFCDFLNREDIDCVITFDPLLGITQVIEAWQCALPPIILSLHNKNHPGLLHQAANTPYFFRRVVSNSLKQEIQAMSPMNRLEVIPNSIDTTIFKPINNQSRDSNIIFCNSRISEGKGIIYLLRAFAQFRQRQPGYELWLCGGDYPINENSSYLNTIKKEVSLLNIGKYVNLLPNLTWTQIPNLIRQSFAVVLPTLYETFGRAALETLACGVPLITSHVGNLPDLVGKSAILVEPSSPRAIYEALNHLCQDPIYYHFLESSGPCVAKQYDNLIVAKRFLDLIHKYMRIL